MIIGFDCFNFEVRQGLVIHGDDEDDYEFLESQCGKPAQLILLKKREDIDKVPMNYLVGIYNWFTGKSIKKFEDKQTGIERVNQVFDVSKLKDITGDKKKAHTALTSDDPQPEKETTKMATKSAKKKSTAKKPAKKAAAKSTAKKASNGEAKPGRKSAYSDTAKIKALVKENPCNKTAEGKLSLRGSQLELIIKAGTLTVAEYLKKPGANTNHIRGLEGKGYISVSGN